MGTVVETSTSSYTVETVPGGEPLGLENGGIPDDHITASSSAGPAPPHLARLNGLSAWCAGKAEDSFLQVNLGSLHLLCAVATQGNPGGNRDYVKRYRLMSSTDGETWTTYEENGNDIIEGNTDNLGVKKKELEKEIITRYVRFCPVDWYCWPCLRVELYGAALNIGDKFPNIQSDNGGSYVVEKVLVTTYETHVDEDGVPDEDSVKEQEKKIIRDAKERQRIEEDQQNRLEEIQIFIEQEEGKRKPSVEDMDFDERKEAEARIQLVLNEERTLERREKPDGEDVAQRDVEEVKHDRVTKEYNRIDEEHRKRMEALTAILGEDEERRRKEKEERRKAEEDARKKREEERRAKEEELKRKREEERHKWDEEHRKWEEERKKRDQELEALLEEGRKKRAEERKKRDEELRKMREDDRRKREDERKKRMEEEMKKLDELRKEREERWNKKTEVVISGIDLEVKENKEDNRQDEKKKKEEGWIKTVETPRRVEEEMKKFRDEERKRLEEERKKLKEKELADAEAEKEFKSEQRVLRQEKPETITRVSVATIQLASPQDIGEEKRRLEWRMQKIEQDRLLREEEERKKREEADRKKKEGEERAKEEEERRRREQEEARERRKEESRSKKEAEERQKREEEERKRQEEDARRRMTLEERRKRLEEDKKKREDEERIWRRAMEERKQREEEEKRKEEESKRRKRLSIDRKKFEEEEKKRLDEIERQRLEQEEKERMEEDRRRREERERWKLKQAERRRSGEIYRHKSEEDLRKREERYSFKEKQRKQRDSKSFEVKWEFINGERVAVPVDESLVSVTSDTSYSEPPEVFDDETPDTSFVTVNAVETRRTPSTDEEDSSRVTSTIRVITTTTTRTRYHASHDHHPRTDSEETSLNGEVVPYRSQPRCDHLLPTDPSVQEAEEMSFFDKFEESEGKLRPFPSWYGGLDMGSLPHLYLPSNPIRDSDIDLLLSIENEGLKSWKRIKKSGELEIYSRKGRERGSPPVNKAIMVLKDISYRDAIDLVSDWDERTTWDKTFDGVSFLDQMADFKLLKCSQKKKNRCVVLASLDREDEEPYYAWAWKGSNHPSVPGDDSKLTVMRLETGICGAIIRPYHDATRSCKITIITQVRGSVPSPLKSTYLTGNPSKWLIWMKKHHNSQVKSTMETEQDEDKNKDDASSVSSKSDKQD